MGFINQITDHLKFQDTEFLRLQLICFDEYWNKNLIFTDHDQAVLDMMDNPLFKLVIPVLKEKFDADNEMLRFIVEVSIILSHQEFESVQWINEKTINRILNSSCELNYEEINILTDFIALIRAYNRYEDTYFYYEVETSVFSDIKLEDLDFKYLVPHDSIYIAKLCELDLLDEGATDLVLAFANYLNEKYGIKYQIIYEAFVDHEINELFGDDSHITYRSLADIILVNSNLLFFCFIVAYIKWKDLFAINDDALFEYLPQVYIDGIKEFWWKCQKWGKHKDIINEWVGSREFDFETYPLLDPAYDGFSSLQEFKGRYRHDSLLHLGPEFIYKLDDFNNFGILMGVDIDLDINYLTNYKYENEIYYLDKVAIEIGKRLYGESYFENLNDGEYCYKIDNSKVIKPSKKKKADRVASIAPVISGRPKKILVECLSDSIPEEKYNYVLKKIKEKTNGKTKKNLLLVFRVAYEVGLLKETPSRQSLIDYGYLEEDLGNDTTFSNYLTNEFKFKEAKEKGKNLWNKELYIEFQKLKEEVCY